MSSSFFFIKFSSVRLAGILKKWTVINVQLLLLQSVWVVALKRLSARRTQRSCSSFLLHTISASLRESFRKRKKKNYALTVNVNIDVLFFCCRDFGAAAGGDTEALMDGGSQVQDSRSSAWSAPCLSARPLQPQLLVCVKWCLDDVNPIPT